MFESRDVHTKLRKIIGEKNSRLCFSADIDNPVRVIEILTLIGQHIAICKIHFDIFIFTKEYSAEWFKREIKSLSKTLNFLIMEDRKFFDISYIVEKQFANFDGWVDLVTVHGLVNDSVLKKINTGVLLVSSMSNNTYDITDKCIELYNNNNNVVGFITQKKISNIMCFTPGIGFKDSTDDDQRYRNISNINHKDMPDIIIVGRAIYNSSNLLQTVIDMNYQINFTSLIQL